MNHPIVVILDLRYSDPNYVGFIPTFLDIDDERPAAEQFAERYLYGGWRPQEGFIAIDGTPTLEYPGDPPLKPIAMMALRDELIFVYLHGYVSIFQTDGAFEACPDGLIKIATGGSAKTTRGDLSPKRGNTTPGAHRGEAAPRVNTWRNPPTILS